MNPEIKSFFHAATSTFSHVVMDLDTQHAAIIDPVLDYDQKAGRMSMGAADQIAEYITNADLTVDWILETHAHADHLTAAPYLKDIVGGDIAISEGICVVQQTFKKIFNLDDEFVTDGSQFDYLFSEYEAFQIGELKAYVMFTPGHSNDSISYVIGDAVFVGDTLFMPDYGSARCDFPGGDAHKMYHSIQQIFTLPDATRMFLCHDYIPQGSQRKPMGETTVGKQKIYNVHIHEGITEQDFVSTREARDKHLAMPELIIPAIQINIRAGHMPTAENNGIVYLKTPINVFGKRGAD